MLEIDLGMLTMHSSMDCMQSGILSRMSMPIGKIWDLIISCPWNYLHNIVQKLGANTLPLSKTPVEGEARECRLPLKYLLLAWAFVFAPRFYVVDEDD